MILLKKRKSKKGFSLLELLLVLGIVAALVVAAFIVYPKVQASQRAQAESNNIATIQAGVKALYTSASSFTGLTNTVAVQAKIFPDNMLSGTGNTAKPINAFKGNVTSYRTIISGWLFFYHYLQQCACSGVCEDCNRSSREFLYCYGRNEGG